MSVLPFRIGTSSYIYPDNVIFNVKKLKDRVEDIEIVLFDTGGIGDVSYQDDLAELKSIKEKTGLSYTIHLPLNVDLGTTDEDKRFDSIKSITSIIRHTQLLDPYAYILHLNLSGQTDKDLESWQLIVNDSLSRILEGADAASTDIAVENLDYPFAYVENIIKDNNLSVCTDIGHLVNTGNDVLRHMDKYLDKTRVIHMHGVDRGRDHVSLRHLDGNLTKGVFTLLQDSNYRGVLTLEVFSHNDLEESIDVLRTYIKWGN